MSIDLEKFVRKHAGKLDRVEVVEEDRLWSGISRALDQYEQPSSKYRIWLSIAAGIIIILTSMLVYTSIYRSPANDDRRLLSAVFPELSKEFSQYDQIIRTRKTAISFDTIDPGQYPDLFEEMQTLDEHYSTALKDLKNLGKDEAILRVLIRYHQRQLDLLERLSNEIEKNKRYHEKNFQRNI